MGEQNNAGGRISILLGGRTALQSSPPIIPGGGPVPPPPLPSTQASAAIIVPNIAARNALTPLVLGMIVYVIDTGSGQWALYSLTSFTPTTWTPLTTQALSYVDANTYSVMIYYNTTTAPILIGIPISEGHRVIDVNVNVITAFNASGVTVTVGDSLDNSRYLDPSLVDLTGTGDYQSTDDYLIPTSTQTYVYFTPGTGGTVGSAQILFSFA